MAEKRNRLTLKDVAMRAGVSTMTVSLALRDQPTLPKSTRERIQKLAAEMGYRPDPALAALNQYRAKVRQTVHGATIAYLSAFDTETGWRSMDFMRRTFEGALERAESLGYRLEHFWMRDPGLTVERLADILQNRGIRGVLVSPLPRPGRLSFPWERFSAVAIGPSLIEPALHRACSDHYQSMMLALEHITAAGHQRIGLILDPDVDQRHQQKYLAAFSIFERSMSRPKNRVTPLLTSNFSVEAVARWLRTQSPDVVVSHDDRALEFLRKAGAVVPEHVSFVSLNRSADQLVTGIDVSPEKIAAAATTQLKELLHDNETGVPGRTSCLMLSGSWVDGSTFGKRACATS